MSIKEKLIFFARSFLSSASSLPRRKLTRALSKPSEATTAANVSDVDFCEHNSLARNYVYCGRVHRRANN